MAETTIVRPTRVSNDAIRRISWSAVFAGTVLAAALQLLLNLLGLSIGLWSMDADALQGLGIGAGIWWLASALLSLYAGAWVAGHLAGIPRRADGVIHGLLVWSLGTLAMVWLVSSAAGAVLGGATSVLSRTAERAGGVVSEMVPDAAGLAETFANAQGVPIADITKEMGEAVKGPQAEQTRRELGELFSQVRQDEFQTPQFRQQLIQFLETRGDVDRDRATELADAAVRRLAETRQALAETGQQIEETSEEVARTSGTAAFWAFLALLTGAISAAFGGRAGTPDRLAPLEVLPTP